MVSGAKPFTGERIETVTYRILTEPTPPLAMGPADLDAVVQRATQKDPGARFDSAETMGRAIAGIGSGADFQRTMAFPAASAAADRTVVAGSWPGGAAQAGYGGVDSNRTVAAPGMGGAPYVHPAPPSPITQIPSSPGTSGATVAKWVVAITIAGVLVLGGIWAVQQATRNAGLRIAVDNGKDALNRGAALYQAKDFAQAAIVFSNVRTAPGADSATKEQATTYEGYCYRELANAAQRNNDWAAAVRWWRMARDLAPGDADVAKSLEAAEKYLASLGEPLPGPPPEPDRTTEHPKPRSQDTPNITRSDLERTQQQAAADADRLLREGDAAAKRGDTESARDFWRKARDLGVGTSTFIEADRRLNQDAAANSPF